MTDVTSAPPDLPLTSPLSTRDASPALAPGKRRRRPSGEAPPLPRELAVLCTLLLRGPQTLGEIKDRSERMFAFTDPTEAERVLEKLAEWPEHSLAKKLPRQSGQKEARYAHLLTGEPNLESSSEGHVTAQPTRIEQLEQQIEQLRSEFEELKRRFDELESQLR